MSFLFFILLILGFVFMPQKVTSNEPLITETQITLYVHKLNTHAIVSIALVGTSNPNENQLTLKTSIGSENITVKNSGNLHITYSINQGENFSFITLFLPEDLGTGDDITITLEYDILNQESNENLIANFYFESYQLINYLKILAWIDPGITLGNITPTPSSVGTINGLTKIIWLLFNSKTFSTSMTLNISSSTGFDAIKVTPLALLLKGKVGEKVSFQVTLKNIYITSVLIKIIKPEIISLSRDQLTLSSNQNITLKVQAKIIDTDSPVILTFIPALLNAKPVQVKIYMTVVQLSALKYYIIGGILALTFLLAYLILKPPQVLLRFIKKKYKLIDKTELQDTTVSSSQLQDVVREKLLLSLMKSKHYDKNEKIVIAHLLEKDGVTQQYLADKTDLSKATISRAVAKLEAKELVRKTPLGMSNILYLNESLLKKRLLSSADLEALEKQNSPNGGQDSPLAIVIITETGLTVFKYEFEPPNMSDINELFGGFLFAVDNIGKEVFPIEDKINKIEFQNFKILVRHLGSNYIAYLYKGNDTMALARLKRFIEALKEQKLIWEQISIDLNGNITIDITTEQEIIQIINKIFPPTK